MKDKLTTLHRHPGKALSSVIVNGVGWYVPYLYKASVSD